MAPELKRGSGASQVRGGARRHLYQRVVCEEKRAHSRPTGRPGTDWDAVRWVAHQLMKAVGTKQ